MIRAMAIDLLQPFVGVWSIETSLGPVAGTATFEWALGGAYLLQRTEIPVPEAPDGLKPDFSPLDFAQRYIGRFSDDGQSIDGAWEIRQPGSDWALDFKLDYTRSS